MLHIKTILCPTDFSEPAREALNVASDLAHHFGAELRLLHVVPVLPTLPPDPNFVFKVPEYERFLHTDAEKNLQTLKTELAAKSIQVTTSVTHGYAAEEIIRAAEAEKADMIVIATHGGTGWQHLIFGSVAEKVVRLASCPVLTIRKRQ
jgi:nucleotide-binding universal stress UspA family protein